MSAATSLAGPHVERPSIAPSSIAASPIVAMLWEHWRLSRIEAGQRLALGFVLAAGALLISDKGETAAFWFLLIVNSMFWLSIAKLNGGQLADGYKPGFPLYLLYPRPVSTATLVSVAMIYDAISCTALYLVSAALISLVFGETLPLFSVAGWLIAFHLMSTCIQWSTRNRAFQWIGSLVLCAPYFLLFKARVATPLRVDFSANDYALTIVVGLVSIAVTIFGVMRQRRGDAVARESRPKEAAEGYPDWMIGYVRLRCPTTTPTKAQVWFELKSSGLPVLSIGLAISMLLFALYALGIAFPLIRQAAMGISVISVPAVLLVLGNNAFGIRRRQGRRFVSAFEAVQPHDTARLAHLKVLVRTVCVLVAFAAVGWTLWGSSALIHFWGEWKLNGTNDASQGLLEVRRQVGALFSARSGFELLALAVTGAIVVGGIITWQASREALRTRYPRGVMVADWVPVVWGVAMGIAGLASRSGAIAAPLATTIVLSLSWLATAGIAAIAIYLLWTGFANGGLGLRETGAAVAICATFVGTVLLLMRSVGVDLAALPASKVVGFLWMVPLILMVTLLAPWSLNRVRHT